MLASTTAVSSRDMPIYGWYLMPEAYSAQLVDEAIREFGVPEGGTVLDPFCGTGTTLVAARLSGYNAVGVEVNPFLSFASRVKTRARFDLPSLKVETERLLKAAHAAIIETDANELHTRYDAPEMPRLERWISKRVVLKVLALRSCIDECVSAANRDIPRLALAAILRGVSNMKLSPHAFGSREVKQDAPVMQAFEAKLRRMLLDIEWLQEQKHLGQAHVIEADIRALHDPTLETQNSKLKTQNSDLAITSPPYLNNLDYTMQTRLELFFLGFINDMEGLKQLRKRMMICDAKATYKDIEDWRRVEEVSSIKAVAQAIDDKLGNRGWGWDYGRMTRQYFGGVLRAMESIHPMLKPGARLVLVLGESAHSGILVPVPTLVAELGELAGYRQEAIRVLRTRRSSSHSISLDESAVVLRRE